MKTKSLILFSFILFYGCSIKLPNRVLEDEIVLADIYDQDLGSQLIKDVKDVVLTGKSVEELDVNTKIVLKDTTTNDRIVVKFEKGTMLDFNLKFKTQLKDNLVYPKIEELNLNSTRPISFLHNGRKLGSISGINTVSNQQIKTDIKSIGIANILLLFFDNYLLSKNKPRFRFNKNLSRIPDFIVEHLKFNYDSLNLEQEFYSIKLKQPFQFQLVDFVLNENLASMSIGELNQPLDNFELNSSNMKFNNKAGSFNIKNYVVTLSNDGYSINKKTNGSAGIQLENGSILGNSNFLSDGSYNNISIDLTDYNYKSVNGNSIVSGSLLINADINRLKNDYDFNLSEFYYVMNPFEINNLEVKYLDDGLGGIKRNFSLNDGLKLNFRDLYFQDFGQYELWTRGVELNLPASNFERIEDINIKTAGNIDLKTNYTQLNVYNGEGKRLIFKNGNQFRLNGINNFYVLKNSLPEFDTINFYGKVDLNIQKLDSTAILDFNASEFKGKVFEEDNIIRFQGILDSVDVGMASGFDAIPKAIRGAKITANSIELAEDGVTIVNNLQIKLPKKQVINELQNQLKMKLVKDYGKVGDIKLKVKTKGLIRISMKLLSIGVYASILDLNLKHFKFNGVNEFDFSLNGRARVKTKNLRETKNIRSLTGKGILNINPGKSLDSASINLTIRASHLDIENFPGGLEKTLSKTILANLAQQISFSPFLNLEQADKDKIGKIVLDKSISIREEGDFFVFLCSGRINP